jgi:hypothetical protein
MTSPTPKKRPTRSTPRPAGPATCVVCADTLRCPTCDPQPVDDLTPSELLDTLSETLPTLTAWDLVDLRRLIEGEVDRRGTSACAGLRRDQPPSAPAPSPIGAPAP